MSTGEPYDLELEVVRPDGTRRQTHARGAAVRDADGRIVRLHGTMQDVTERKAAEKAILEAESEYRKIFEEAMDGIYRISLEGRVLAANPAMARILGFDSAQEAVSAITYSAHQLWIDPNERSHFIALLQECEAVRGYECKWKRKDGTPIWVSVNCRMVRGVDGKTPYYEGLVEDISERKRAEEALRESEERFRAIFENAAMGIALVDVHGHPVESNAVLQKMLGYTNLELAGKVFTEFTYPDDVRADWDLFTELADGKRDQYRIEKRFLQKGGQVVWGRLHVSLVRNQKGEFKYSIKMVEDISEHKRTTEALRQLSGRLLRSQDAERRRIARELHDTTAQGLAALAINLSVVKDSAADLNPRARACVSESLGLAQQCSREIRTLSYLLHPPLLEEAGLGSALRWFVDGYANRTGICVDLEMPPELTRLPGEIELALYRIVQEGLTNIHLHSGSKRAHICLKWCPNQAVLTIADEGRGLPPGLLQRGGERVTKRGVGISGMRERIRQLGGQFEVATGSNGTTLTATVSLGKDQA
jgi:PAS domain S-box-containing protein